METQVALSIGLRCLFLLSRFTTAIEVYRTLLGIKSVKPVDSNELHLEYEPLPTTGSAQTGPNATVTLALLFNESTRRLEDAKVRLASSRHMSFSCSTGDLTTLLVLQLVNHSADIDDAVDVARKSNDVPSLIAKVRTRIQ